MIRKRKTATLLMLILMLPATFVFAGSISSVKLDNVVFSGKINDVGTDSVPAPVEIVNSPSGSAYELSGAHISILKISGSGSVVISGGDVSGKIEISGTPTVTFSGCTLKAGASVELKSGNSTVKFESCTINMTDGTSAAVKGASGYNGSLMIGTAGKKCTVSAPASFSVDLSSTSVRSLSLATDNTTSLKAVLLNNCTSLSSLDIGTVPVETLNLSGCTNSTLKATLMSSGSPWSTWRITGASGSTEAERKGLILRSMGLSGNVSITNNNIYSLDVSENNISELIAGGSNLKKLWAKNSKITAATVSISTDSSSLLDMSENRLGSNTTPRWGTTTSEYNTTSSQKPADDPVPAATEGATYDTYSSSPIRQEPGWTTCHQCGGSTTVNGTYHPAGYVQCPTCGGTGSSANPNCNRCGGSGEVWESECPSCGSTNTSMSGGRLTCNECGTQLSKVDCPVCGGGSCSNPNCRDGEVWQDEYYDKEPCPNCMKNSYTPKTPGHAGEEECTWYTWIEYTHTCSKDFGLIINGNAIHTNYDGNCNRTGSLTVNFSKEWDNLGQLQVDLYDNGICYKAGFAKSVANGEWKINFTVDFRGLRNDATVVKINMGEESDPDSDTLGMGHFDYESFFHVGTGSSTLGTGESSTNKRILEIEKYNYNPLYSHGCTAAYRNGDHQKNLYFRTSNLKTALSSFGTVSSGRQVYSMMLYRHMWEPNWGDNDDAGRGPEIHIYPFGVPNQN